MNVNDPYEFEGIYNNNIFMFFVFICNRNTIGCLKIFVDQLFSYLKVMGQENNYKKKTIVISKMFTKNDLKQD